MADQNTSDRCAIAVAKKADIRNNLPLFLELTTLLSEQNGCSETSERPGAGKKGRGWCCADVGRALVETGFICATPGQSTKDLGDVLKRPAREVLGNSDPVTYWENLSLWSIQFWFESKFTQKELEGACTANGRTFNSVFCKPELMSARKVFLAERKSRGKRKSQHETKKPEVTTIRAKKPKLSGKTARHTWPWQTLDWLRSWQALRTRFLGGGPTTLIMSQPLVRELRPFRSRNGKHSAWQG
jgi:hypothetical protein